LLSEHVAHPYGQTSQALAPNLTSSPVESIFPNVLSPAELVDFL
jgi:hypothetical protein